MKRTPFKRNSGQIKRTSGVKKVGRKTTEWKKVREEVVEFLKDINLPWTCEARLEGCTGELFLTLAHSKKRRNIESTEELKEVALLCQGCHSIVDAWKPEHTEKYIKMLIERRG